MDLLTSLCQNNSTHISDHIHEWRRRQSLIKTPIPEQLLVDWFTKSLFPPISRDVAMGGVVTEEKDINWAQYLEFFYSQSKNLYDLIPQAPRPSTNPTKPPTETSVDGVSVQSIPHQWPKLPSNKMLLLLLLQLLRFPPR